MSILVPIGISNRHIHLTEDVYNKLFKEKMTLKKELNQYGEFASNQTLTIKSDKGIIKNVRVIGPFRNYNQVEITRSDARILGLNPPVRTSGDVTNSETITLVSEIASVTLENACIIATRHIHMNEETAKELGLENNDIVKVQINTQKSGTIDAIVKITSNGYFEMHIDTDDANAFLLNNNDKVEIIK